MSFTDTTAFSVTVQPLGKRTKGHKSPTIAEQFMFKSPICKKFCIAMHNFQGSHDGETIQRAFDTSKENRIFLTINYKL